jgi:Transposase and inactivated derivatives, IS30 family
MAASRLSDAQRDEIVAGYRQGVSASALAMAFGCSPNTVSRVVKTALSPEEVAALKLQRGRGEAAAPASLSQAGPEPEPEQQPPELDQLPEPEAEQFELVAAGNGIGSAERLPLAAGNGLVADEEADGPGVLAIDDADDFAGDDGDEDAEQDGEELEEFGSDDGTAPASAAQEPVECRCLSEAQLPATAYLLVDKTVELQPVSLGDCSDLGPLPEEEAVRQALQVYVNPRNAKRQCGRSQRVIPLPDLSLLQRTAPFLLAQGISRVVIEGSVYSLPGS